MFSIVNQPLKSVFRNDEIIISRISVTDIIFDGILGEWNYKPFPK